MDGLTLFLVFVLFIMEIYDLNRKKPVEKEPESREEQIKTEFNRLMEYSEQDAINSKKR